MIRTKKKNLFVTHLRLGLGPDLGCSHSSHPYTTLCWVELARHPLT